MTSNVKQIIFFLIVYCLLVYSMSLPFRMINFKLTKEIYLMFAGISIILLSAVFISYKGLGIATCKQVDNFHFEVTPAKKCEGYPYMQSSDPKLLQFCTDLLSTPKGVDEYDSVNCCGGCGYVGRPLATFEYTPESNSKWENERCSQKITDTLQVL